MKVIKDRYKLVLREPGKEESYGLEGKEGVKRRNSILASPIIKSGWLSKKQIQRLKNLGSVIR